ncbi:hypothetical protein DRW07_01795 [Alteromonas sediminis]|uniref:Uncharacterized protein n=1 Tax=Alteromonas sediminis TaxID=2259342 RepID=A0A3N5Y584_9ALTE|nr:hypothetical protein [Alteromonas sediminis]RPJ68166.1 hypothetical protein DRW07_01795 [Alteromonas sediminis]
MTQVLKLALWFAVFSMASTSGAMATSIKGLAFDCTGVELSQANQANLTDAEKLLLMQQALIDSVDQYSSCMKKVQDDMVNNGSETGSDGGAATASQAKDGSVVSQTNDNNVEQTPSIPPPKTVTSNGRGPKVIPPADNASAICKLLYEEIKSEQDSTTQQRLSEEYKRYGCQ